jgi:hypothetical protein
MGSRTKGAQSRDRGAKRKPYSFVMARRLARTGRLSCHVGVGLGLALCAGCAGTPPRRAAVAEVCPEPGPPAFPNAAGPCDGAADDDPDDPPPDAADGTSCVPRYARGRELARDDARKMRVFEACLPRSRYRPAAPPEVDPRRVILVRTGGQPPTDDDLETVVEALAKARAAPPERAPPGRRGVPGRSRGIDEVRGGRPPRAPARLAATDGGARALARRGPGRLRAAADPVRGSGGLSAGPGDAPDAGR